KSLRYNVCYDIIDSERSIAISTSAATICHRQGARHTHSQEERNMRACRLCFKRRKPMMKECLIAIVEVGDRFITRLVTTRADRCTMKEAQQIARGAGYRVIEDLCYIVPVAHEVHFVVAVEEEVKE